MKIKPYEKNIIKKTEYDWDLRKKKKNRRRTHTFSMVTANMFLHPSSYQATKICINTTKCKSCKPCSYMMPAKPVGNVHLAAQEAYSGSY